MSAAGSHIHISIHLPLKSATQPPLLPHKFRGVRYLDVLLYPTQKVQIIGYKQYNVETDLKYELYANCIPNLGPLKSWGRGEVTSHFAHALFRFCFWKKPDTTLWPIFCNLLRAIQCGQSWVRIMLKKGKKLKRTIAEKWKVENGHISDGKSDRNKVF